MSDMEKALLELINIQWPLATEGFKDNLCDFLDLKGFLDEYFMKDEIIQDRIKKEVEAAERTMKEVMLEQFEDRYRKEIWR